MCSNGMTQYSSDGYIFYGIILSQEDFCRLLGTPQPYIGLKAVEPEFSVVQTDSKYEFKVNDQTVVKIKEMLEHPFNIIVRVAVDSPLKVFVGVCRVWDIPVSCIAYCDEVFGLLELSKVLGFPELKSGPVDTYIECGPVDDRVDMYPDWMLY